MGVSDPLKNVPTIYKDSLQIVNEKKFKYFFSKVIFGLSFNMSASLIHTLSTIVLLGYHSMSRDVLRVLKDPFQNYLFSFFQMTL